jgi:hypothetical protein
MPDAAGVEPRGDGPPRIEFIGRFDTRDPAAPIAGWPGCRILARFSGASVSVTFRETDDDWMVGAPSEWDLAIDGVWQNKLVMTPGTRTYGLATGLGSGAHDVELYKRSEAQNGTTQFLGFDFAGGALLAPPRVRSRHIEVVGDSVAAGFGIEGLGYPNDDCPGVDSAARWQNFRKSFGAILGGTFDAELHGTVYSGKGLVKNIWRPDHDTMSVLFPLASPTDPSSTYDFTWQPDVAIVMIGGNDFAVGQPNENEGGGPATPTEFTDAYRTFVATLRRTYPKAFLVLSVSPSVSDSEPAGRQTRTNIVNATNAIARESNGAGDTNVQAFAPTVAPQDELTACDGHGNPAFHARVAGELATIVKQKLGW